jgi:hypothetical protein
MPTAHRLRLLDLPPKPPAQRHHRMSFRMPADRWDALSRAAAARNVTPSALVRHLVGMAIEEVEAEY